MDEYNLTERKRQPITRRQLVKGITAAAVVGTVVAPGTVFGDESKTPGTGNREATWQPTFPPQIPATSWLRSHQRLCFGVDEKTLDEVIRDGANVICGGTNAAGVGFAGGPFILGKNGQIIDIITGVPAPEKTLEELRARVDAAHAKGTKVLGEVIRFYMTPWIQAEHPDWQVINSPGGKPITFEQLKDNHVLGCWNSPYGDWFIQSSKCRKPRKNDRF